jgi:DNA-directed RNA polymerase subunit RPC12/RpoP
MSAILVACLIMGVITAAIARHKGSSFVIWFIVGFLFPGVGLLAVFLMKSTKLDPRRECPKCGAVLPITAQVCMRCGEDLDYPEELLAPKGFTVDE